MEVTAPLFNLLYKLLIAIFITAAYDNSMVQIFFLLLLNVVYSIYLILKRPYIRIGYR